MPVGDLFQLQVAEDLPKVLQSIALRALRVLSRAQLPELNPPLLCTVQAPVSHFVRKYPGPDVGQEVIAEGPCFLAIVSAAALLTPRAVAVFVAERIEASAPVESVLTSWHVLSSCARARFYLSD